MPPVRSTPIPEALLGQFEHLLTGLDAAGIHWLAGYLAGVASRLPVDGKAALAIPASTASAAQTRATVLYGSQTGNAKRLAETLAQRIQAAGLAARLERADRYPQRELKEERLLFIVISTQGEGEPPDDARGLVDFIEGKRAPKLPELRYAVLGLGDSSYPDFCAIGRRLDDRLAALGGKRLIPRGDADVDLETVSNPWLDAALQHAALALQQEHAKTPVPGGSPLLATPLSTCSRERPFIAQLLVNQRITGRNSDKNIRHLEFSLAGSDLSYQPGDALGVWPRQSPALVTAVLETLKLDGETLVAHEGEQLPLATWLSERRELTVLTRPFLLAQAERNGDATLQQALQPAGRDVLAKLLGEWQLLDLLRHHPAAWDAAGLVHTLRPLAPRLYSIASSPLAADEEVHITVAQVYYQGADGPRWGAASHYLSDLEEDASIPVFIEANERFRLPADDSRDIIMIGPGTGVAPFRAFVQHRALSGARGRNWLLFGNPHASEDFLYQLEWQEALRRGELQRLDLAFSRDQADKIYVQQRLREQASEVYHWLSEGAYLYVCGDATRMARDVHQTLIDIVAEQGAQTPEAAAAWLGELQTEGRYLRDVY